MKTIRASGLDETAGGSRPGRASVHRLWGIPPVLWLVWLVYLLSASGRVGNQDAEVTLSMTRALLEGDVALPAGLAGSIRGDGGIRTSPYGVGHSVYLMPYVWVGRGMAAMVPKLPVVMWEEFVVSFANVPVMGGLLAYLVMAWRRAGASEGRVGVGVVLFGLCTMLWPYAKLPFSDSLMALATFGAWCHWTRDGTRWDGLWSGAWLGVALVSRRQADSVVPMLMALAGWDAWRKGVLGRLGWMAVGMVPAVALRLWYNAVRFGDVFRERQRGLAGVSEVLQAEPGEWMWELLFSSSYGYLPYNLVPLAVLVLGLAGLWRRRRGDALVALVVLLGGLGFLSLMRFGPGVSFGSRYLVYTVAFLGLAWPFVPGPGSGWVWGTWGPMVACSLWLMAGGVAVDVVPVVCRVRVSQPPFEQWKGLYGEWGRVLSARGGPDLAELESDANWRHDAFRRPDFWWCHLYARSRKGDLAE